MQPHLLNQFFAAQTGELPAELQPLVRGEDWQQVFSPKTTGAMRSVVQRIIDCPFFGSVKRLYLQGKVFELMALQLHGIVGECASAPKSLKPSTIARIHYAAEILRSYLEDPPFLAESSIVVILTLKPSTWLRMLLAGFPQVRFSISFYWVQICDEERRTALSLDNLMRHPLTFLSQSTARRNSNSLKGLAMVPD